MWFIKTEKHYQHSIILSKTIYRISVHFSKGSSKSKSGETNAHSLASLIHACIISNVSLSHWNYNFYDFNSLCQYANNQQYSVIHRLYSTQPAIFYMKQPKHVDVWCPILSLRLIIILYVLFHYIRLLKLSMSITQLTKAQGKTTKLRKRAAKVRIGRVVSPEPPGM